MTRHIFISYSKKDKEFTAKLAEDLREHGFIVWYDTEIGGGEQWRETIEIKVKEAQDIIIVLSPNAIDSDWVQHEGTMAYTLGKNIYPILMKYPREDQKLPPWIDKLQYINFISEPREDAFNHLVRSLTPPNPIQDLLDQQVNAYQQTGELIGDAILKVIEEARDGLTVSEEAQDLISQSQKTLRERQEREEQLVKDREKARQNELEKAQQLAITQQQRAIIFALGLFVALILSVVSFLLYRQSNQNLLDAQFANTQSAKNLHNANIANTQSAANAATALYEGVRAEKQAATAQAASTQAVAERDAKATAQVEVESQRNVAEEQARVALSRKLAAQANSYLEEDLGLALLLANEAVEEVGTFEARQSLLNGLLYNPRLVASLPGTEFSFNAFNPNSNILISSDWDTIELWDISNPSKPQHLADVNTGDSFTSIASSQDDQMMVSAMWDDTFILWDISNPKEPQPFPFDQPMIGFGSNVYDVAFSPDGKILASGSCNETVYDYPSCTQGSVYLWDVSNPEKPRLIGQPLQSTVGPVFALDFSPDGHVLASGDGNTVRLWDISNPEEPLTIGQPTTSQGGRVYGVRFSPDGKILASGGGNGTLTLWDISNLTHPMQLMQSPSEQLDRIFGIAFSADGMFLAVAGCQEDQHQFCAQGKIRLWNIADTSSPISLEPSLFYPAAIGLGDIAFSQDGKTLISTGGSFVQLWDVSDFDTLPLFGQELTGHMDMVIGVTFNPNPERKYLASGSNDSIRFWDVSNREVIIPLGEPLLGSEGGINGIIYSPGGNILAVEGTDTVSLWDASNPLKPILLSESINGCACSKSCIAIKPGNNILALGSAESSIRFWDISNPEAPHSLGQPLIGHANGVWDIAFSQNGQIMASAGGSDTIIIWDVSDPSESKILSQATTRRTEAVLSVAFNPDGKILASGSADSTVRMWDISNPTKPFLLDKILEGHTEPVWSIAFSPDGKILASGGLDSFIILWDISTLENPRLLAKLPTDTVNLVWSLDFDPVGNLLASGGSDNSLILWDVEFQSWRQRACTIAGRNFTQKEWVQFFPEEPYRKTCDQWPLPDDLPTSEQ